MLFLLLLMKQCIPVITVCICMVIIPVVRFGVIEMVIIVAMLPDSASQFWLGRN